MNPLLYKLSFKDLKAPPRHCKVYATKSADVVRHVFRCS